MNSKTIPHEDNTTNKPKNQDKKLCYIYKHIRLDTNDVFYIGKGTNTNGKYERANDLNGRNPHWKRIVKKHKHSVEIIIDNLTEKEAFEKEIELILHYGRIDLGTGTLVNKTSGGDGVCGRVVSEETKEKLSYKLLYFDENGKLIKEYKSLESSKNDGFNPTGITLCINGSRRTSNNCTFQKINDNLIHAYKVKNPKIKLSQIELEVYDEDMVFIKKYDNMNDAKKDGFILPHINNCINGKWRSSNSHKFQKINSNLYRAYKLDLRMLSEINKHNNSWCQIGLDIYGTDGLLVKKYDWLVDAEIDGYMGSTIKKCIEGERNKHNGCRYEKISDKLYRGYKLSENEMDEIKSKHNSRITDGKSTKLILHDEFEVVTKTYNSLKDSIVDGFSDGNINSCVQGYRKSHKDYRFERIDDKLVHGYKLTQEAKNIIQKNSYIINRDSKTIILNIYDIKGKLETTYNTLTEANKDGFNSASIRNCIKKICKQHKGYRYEKISNGIINAYKLP